MSAASCAANVATTYATATASVMRSSALGMAEFFMIMRMTATMIAEIEAYPIRDFSSARKMEQRFLMFAMTHKLIQSAKLRNLLRLGANMSGAKSCHINRIAVLLVFSLGISPFNNNDTFPRIGIPTFALICLNMAVVPYNLRKFVILLSLFIWNRNVFFCLMLML